MAAARNFILNGNIYTAYKTNSVRYRGIIESGCFSASEVINTDIIKSRCAVYHGTSTTKLRNDPTLINNIGTLAVSIRVKWIDRALTAPKDHYLCELA